MAYAEMIDKEMIISWNLNWMFLSFFKGNMKGEYRGIFGFNILTYIPLNLKCNYTLCKNAGF